ERYKNLDKKLLYVLAGVGGLALLIAVLPGLFLSFKPANHQEVIQSYAQQLQDNTLAHQLVAALVKDRAGLARADGFRSLVFILITFGLLWLLVKNKLKSTAV